MWPGHGNALSIDSNEGDITTTPYHTHTQRFPQSWDKDAVAPSALEATVKSEILRSEEADNQDLSSLLSCTHTAKKCLFCGN